MLDLPSAKPHHRHQLHRLIGGLIRFNGLEGKGFECIVFLSHKVGMTFDTSKDHIYRLTTAALYNLDKAAFV